MTSCMLGHLHRNEDWSVKRRRKEQLVESAKLIKIENDCGEYVRKKSSAMIQCTKKPLSKINSYNLTETYQDDKETVTYVNNLFSPVNKLQAIPLSLGELRRRSEYPEYFGRSEMVAYLRHSKTTGNELVARFKLNSKTRSSNVNVLSRLCEREARTLAAGIHKINCEYFPTDFVAETMKSLMKKDEKKQPRKNGERSADNDNETISNTIVMLRNLRKSLEYPDDELAEDLEVFDRATHTFGRLNIINHISFVESYLAQLHEKL